MGAWQSNEKKKEDGGENEGIVTWLKRKMVSIVSSCKRGVKWVTSSLVSVFNKVKECMRSLASACKRGFKWVANLVISACKNVINWLCSMLSSPSKEEPQMVRRPCSMQSSPSEKELQQLKEWLQQLFDSDAMKFLEWVFDSNGTSDQPLMSVDDLRLILKLIDISPWEAAEVD